MIIGLCCCLFVPHPPPPPHSPTHTSADDYMINLPNNILTVMGSGNQTCFSVSLVTDRISEGLEVVEVTLLPTSSFPANLSVQFLRRTTQLVIEDMDSELTVWDLGTMTSLL